MSRTGRPPSAPRKLIETALPLEAINRSAVRESQGRISPLQLWWSHKPAAVCRAAVLASVLDDPGDPARRAELLALVARVASAPAGDTPAFAAAREALAAACPRGRPTVLDPFSGSGSIPAEAQRLGLPAVASDLNPVAVIAARALLEVPAALRHAAPLRGGDPGVAALAEDVLHYGRRLGELAGERLGHLYPPAADGAPVIAWLWARTAPCVACGRQMPLVHSFDLSRRPGRAAWVDPDPAGFRIGPGPGIPAPPAGTVDRRAVRCLHCGRTEPLPLFRARARTAGLGQQLLAVVVRSGNRRRYLPPDPTQEAVARSARPGWSPQTPLPQAALGFTAQQYGLKGHRDLYTARQLQALGTFAELIGWVRREAEQDALRVGLPRGEALRQGGTGACARGEAVALYLALALDRVAARWCTFARWHRTRENIEHPFASPGLHLLWDFAEANPFSPGVGNWLDAVEAVTKALRAAPAAAAATPDARAGQAPAERVPAPAGPLLICTDPPYFDTLPYADMADLFYIWLRHVLADIYPDLCAEELSPKDGELVADPQRYGGRAAAAAHFRQRLTATFRHLRGMAGSDLPMTVFYAFRERRAAADGWEAMCTCLLEADLQITATWPLRTEHAQRLRNNESNALASCLLLVCRPRPGSAATIYREDWLTQLRALLPATVAELTAAGVPPVDLLQCALGPGIALYSRYAAVLAPGGEAMSVGAALAHIRDELDTVLAARTGALDAATRFCTAWLRRCGWAYGPVAAALERAQAEGTSLEELAGAGLIETGPTQVRLRRPAEGIPAGQSLWCALHAAMAGTAPAADPGPLRALAQRLYTLSAQAGWAAEARAYNAAALALGSRG